MARDLDARLLRAHAEGRTDALIGLYAEAADCAPTPDAAGFFRTHAYVLALEAGDRRAAALHAALRAEGREH